MIRFALPLLAAFTAGITVTAGITATLTAQTPRVQFYAHTNVGAFAKTLVKTALVTKTRGQSIYGGVHAIITGDSTVSRLYLQSPTTSGTEASLYWYGRAYNTRGGTSTIAGTTQSTDWRSPVQGPHTIDVLFTGKATGTMTIYYGGRLAGTGGRASVAVDMDANGSVEYRWAQPTSSKKITFPYTINGTRRIRITGDCLAFTTATGPSSFTYESSLRFVLTPKDGVLSPYGSGCGPKLTGTITRNKLSHSLSLVCQGAFPNRPVMFSIGARAIHVNFPGTNCPLLVDPVVVAPVHATSTGWAYLRATQSGFFNDTIRFQAVPVDSFAGKVATSNAMTLTFR